MRLTSRTPGAGFRGSSAALAGLGLIAGMCLSPNASFAAPGYNMGGHARGGETPISGANVQLWEVGTSGYGSAPHKLGSAFTDPQGFWNITGYHCTAPSSLLYLTLDGGNAGSGNNVGIKLTAVAGPCANQPPFVVINEITTVATTYAMAQFTSTTNPENIGSPFAASPDHNGVNVAATLAITNLMNIGNGTAASFLSTGVNSPATINSVADILTPCVNSSGPTSSACAALFAATTFGSQPAPTDTLGATLSIALHPANNTAALYSILQSAASQPGGLPFTPAVTSAPTDWLIGLNYTQKTFGEIRGLAIDAFGQAWVGSSVGPSVVVLSPVGASMAVIAGTGITNPQTPAIDSLGNVWVANNAQNTVTEISNKGVVLFTTPAGSGGLNQPLGIGIDSFDNVWIANFNGSVTELCGAKLNCAPPATTVGAPISPSSGFTGGGLFGDTRLTIDTMFNNVWVANLGTGGATELDAAGAPVGHFAGGGQEGELGITVDPNGNIWTANKTSVTELSASGAVLRGPISGGGISTMSRPFGINSDSTGNIWLTNFQNNAVTEIATDGTILSPSNGFTAGGLIKFPRNSIAVDASGNVWLSMNQPSSVTVLVGAATPVKTPEIGRQVLP